MGNSQQAQRTQERLLRNDSGKRTRVGRAGKTPVRAQGADLPGSSSPRRKQQQQQKLASHLPQLVELPVSARETGDCESKIYSTRRSSSTQRAASTRRSRQGKQPPDGGEPGREGQVATAEPLPDSTTSSGGQVAGSSRTEETGRSKRRNERGWAGSGQVADEAEPAERAGELRAGELRASSTRRNPDGILEEEEEEEEVEESGKKLACSPVYASLEGGVKAARSRQAHPHQAPACRATASPVPGKSGAMRVDVNCATQATRFSEALQNVVSQDQGVRRVQEWVNSQPFVRAAGSEVRAHFDSEDAESTKTRLSLQSRSAELEERRTQRIQRGVNKITTDEKEQRQPLSFGSSSGKINAKTSKQVGGLEAAVKNSEKSVIRPDPGSRQVVGEMSAAAGLTGVHTNEEPERVGSSRSGEVGPEEGGDQSGRNGPISCGATMVVPSASLNSVSPEPTRTQIWEAKQLPRLLRESEGEHSEWLASELGFSSASEARESSQASRKVNFGGTADSDAGESASSQTHLAHLGLNTPRPSAEQQQEEEEEEEEEEANDDDDVTGSPFSDQPDNRRCGAPSRLEESCSLCQYLQSIREAIERKSGSNDSSASGVGGPEQDIEKAQVVCTHQSGGRELGIQRSAYNNNNNDESRQELRTTTIGDPNGLIAKNNISNSQLLQEGTSIWSDIINLPESESESQFKCKSGPSQRLLAKTRVFLDQQEGEEEEKEKEDSTELEKLESASQVCATRPSSAHSKLCPSEVRPEETGGFIEEKTLTETTLTPQGVRRPKLSALCALSLDHSSNRQQRQQSRQVFNRPDKGRSQSNKLILISTNNVAYTIRVANTLNQDDNKQSKTYNSTIVANQGGEGSSGSSNGNLKANSSNDSKTGKLYESSLELQAKEKQASDDSCKKFLVKKISSSNRRENNRKKQQVNLKKTSSIRELDNTVIEQSTSGSWGLEALSTEETILHSEIISDNIELKEQSGVSDEYLESTRVPTKICIKSELEDSVEELEVEANYDKEEENSNNAAMVTLSPGSSLDISSANCGSEHRSVALETVRMSLPAPDGSSESHFPSDDAAKSCGLAAKRLRDLAAHLEHGSVPQSVLYQTLEYAASILDSVSMDQISRVSDEEEGDLSEVQSDAVPNEVRKWLESTFTRNSISQKRRSEDKLKFRSVANAIRAGIVVDRIYRRMSASSPFVSAEVSNLLRSIDHWSFDCFSVNQASNGQVLKSVGYELFNRYGLMYKFKIPTSTLKNFLTQIELGYVKHKNPYHNNLHAADVTQTVHYMLWQAGLTNWLSDLEIFATLLAAIIHDYLHTGTTNNFHVMSQSDTALIYNDRAVLENFHICQAFTLMKNEDCNILAGLSKDEYREFRSLVIDMVLATDMSSHFQQIKAMKNILNHSDNFNADKSKILSLVIHISDISHPAKEWELHSTWTQLLMEEFFRQGDREKELDLECSPLCDRETTLVAESQLGFIEFIVSPSLEVCGDVLDRVHFHLAEANARPILPASARAASVVTSGSGSQPLAAIEGRAGNEQPAEPRRGESQQRPLPLTDKSLETRPAGNGGHPQRKPGKLAPNVPERTSCSSSTPSTSSAGSGASGEGGAGPASGSSSSLAGSFTSGENSLTSNLRKMIVSSSATIGRRLNNIAGSVSSGGQPQPSTPPPPHPPPPPLPAPPPPLPSRSKLGPAGQKTAGPSFPLASASSQLSDFATRQANYKHPVIQCESSSPNIERPKSCDPRRDNSHLQQQRTLSSDISGSRDGTTGSALPNQAPSLEAAQEASQSKNSSSNSNNLKQVDFFSTKRSSSSALATCGQPGRSTTCGQLLAPIKVQRPWIKCLERNKKMWQERAITDAKARELREKLKQQQPQQIEDVSSETQNEPAEQ